MIERDNGLVSANNRTYTAKQYLAHLKKEEARQESARRERVKWHMLNEEFNRNPEAFIMRLESRQKMRAYDGFMQNCSNFMRNNGDLIHGCLLVAVMIAIGICGAP